LNIVKKNKKNNTHGVISVDQSRYISEIEEIDVTAPLQKKDMFKALLSKLGQLFWVVVTRVVLAFLLSKRAQEKENVELPMLKRINKAIRYIKGSTGTTLQYIRLDSLKNMVLYCFTD
jgi:hypothetical protein